MIIMLVMITRDEYIAGNDSKVKYNDTDYGYDNIHGDNNNNMNNTALKTPTTITIMIMIFIISEISIMSW